MRSILAIVTAALMGFAQAAWADTEITFYYPIAVGGPLTTVIDGLAADFEKQNPGVKVKPIYAGNYDDARGIPEHLLLQVGGRLAKRKGTVLRRFLRERGVHLDDTAD